MTPGGARSGDGANGRTLLDVRDLEVSYGGVRALRGLSVVVPAGEIVAVLGSNGAGKSTLLRAVSGTLSLQRGTIDGGSIELEGTTLVGLDPAAFRDLHDTRMDDVRRVEADQRLAFELDRAAVDRAALQCKRPGDGAQERGLAGTVAAEDGDDLAGRDRQRESM